ncbi:MAG: hypothetical protein ACRDHK_09210 [Actinomycetota bacterium]
MARRRYMAVDPDNRLVADELEAEWNDRLRGLAEAQETYDRAREADRRSLTEEQRARILQLATDFPALWRDPRTQQRERKRMVRLLIEDVTLVKNEAIDIHVRFKGGRTTGLSVPIPLAAFKLRNTPPEVIAEIDSLLDRHTDGEVAAILNERGFTSYEGKAFRHVTVQRLRRGHALKSRFDHLRDRGMLTLAETAELLGVATSTVKVWRDHGLLAAHRFNDKGECLFECPGGNRPVKKQGTKLTDRRRAVEILSDEAEEVQCGA